MGLNWIQIREKDLNALELTELVRYAVAETKDCKVRIIVNDRFDVALAAGAGGVHLGEASIPVKEVASWRHSAGIADFLIGASCHSAESAVDAERNGADYIFFGPVFATPSKASFGSPQGIERLRQVCGAVQIPVVAIGGIIAETAPACIAAGGAGIAAIRMFQESRDITARISPL
jgi:thiamine-phosphate pyrophosphorylase